MSKDLHAATVTTALLTASAASATTVVTLSVDIASVPSFHFGDGGTVFNGTISGEIEHNVTASDAGRALFDGPSGFFELMNPVLTLSLAPGAPKSLSDLERSFERTGGSFFLFGDPGLGLVISTFSADGLSASSTAPHEPLVFSGPGFLGLTTIIETQFVAVTESPDVTFGPGDAPQSLAGSSQDIESLSDFFELLGFLDPFADTGEFDQIELSSFPASFFFTGTSTQVEVTDLKAVPLPASLPLLLAGFGAIGIVARRRS